MKTLIIYYSRTGTTEKVAEELKQKLDCDLELIRDTKKRSGLMGYFICGKEGMKRLTTKIMPVKSRIKLYDLVMIGTPIWSWNMSSPVRSFLKKYSKDIKSAAFFCTMGRSGSDKAFREMKDILKKEPKATMALLTKEVQEDNHLLKLEKFLKDVSKFK